MLIKWWPGTHFEIGFKLIVKCHRVVMYFHAPCGTFVFYVVIVKWAYIKMVAVFVMCELKYSLFLLNPNYEVIQYYILSHLNKIKCTRYLKAVITCYIWCTKRILGGRIQYKGLKGNVNMIKIENFGTDWSPISLAFSVCCMLSILE